MPSDSFDDPKRSKSFQIYLYMFAGAFAGVSEHTLMYPFDVIRTRMQSIDPQGRHRSTWTSFTNLITIEKLKTFRGIGVVVSAAGPAHALYFSLYENSKSLLLSFYNDSHYNQTYRAITHGASGCIATLAHDAVMNPVDVIKQRMQMLGSPFESSRKCARHILQTEGARAFYRSYFTQLTMNLPFSAIHFMSYELMQDIMNKKREFDALTHIVSGGVAGAFAAGFTTPLDVCKTLLNTQEKLALVVVKTDHVTGLIGAIKVIYRCCGLSGFFQGLSARIIVAAPSTAISWLVYEGCKKSFGEKLDNLLRD